MPHKFVNQQGITKVMCESNGKMGNVRVLRGYQSNKTCTCIGNLIIFISFLYFLLSSYLGGNVC